MACQFEDKRAPILYGDVHFIFKFRGMMYDTQLCRIALNTAFIPPNNVLFFNKQTVSPDSIKKNAKVTDNFMIQMVFEDFCGVCNQPHAMRLD